MLADPHGLTISFGILGALQIHSAKWKTSVFHGILGAVSGRFVGIVGAKRRHSRGLFTYRSYTESCSGLVLL